LPQELVVVDESSMVDLALMDRLLRSVGPDAHLVLLGDADQLPSVDAGAVFRDLCRTPALSAGEATVRLTHSYRMDAEDSSGRAILAAARRVRSGEPLRPGIDFVERARVEEVALRGVELLPAGRQRRVAWWERWMRSLPEPEQVAGRAFERTADGEWRLEDHQVLSALLDALESARILTAHRGYAGGTGATAVNLWFHERHARAAGAGSRADLLPGEPVLVTRNDYRRNLFNGDQGAIVRVAEVTGEARLHALFRLEGALRTFALESLGGGLELSWATTVHKAQGSEMERVTLVLPDLPSRILDRDLVYTAVTRARRSVVLLGSATVLREAAARKLDRSTGLADLLDDPRSEPTAPGTQLDLPWAKGQS
jgi:exodeoxyribonuclease V alpha subunit